MCDTCAKKSFRPNALMIDPLKIKNDFMANENVRRVKYKIINLFVTPNHQEFFFFIEAIDRFMIKKILLYNRYLYIFR